MRRPLFAAAALALALAVAGPLAWPDAQARAETRSVTRAQADAEWAQASALSDAGLVESASAALGPIAENPAHPHFLDALARLANIARAAPEGADIESWFDHVPPDAVGSLTRSDAGGVGYLLGKSLYRAGSYDAAISALVHVDPSDPLAPRALLWMSAAYVRQRSATPAVAALQRALATLDAALPSYDRAYLRDLALASLARIYFSSAIQLDEGTDAPTVDATRLSAAVKYWERLDTGSALWPDASFELATAYFLAGDRARAEGLARFAGVVAGGGRHAVSLRVLRVASAFKDCAFDDAHAQLLGVRAIAGPLEAHLGAAIARAAASGRDDAFFALLVAVRDGRAAIEPDAGLVVQRALVDRSIARRMAYLGRIDAEGAALARSSFAAWPVGQAARVALDRARARVASEIGRQARDLLTAEHDELTDALAAAAGLDDDLNQVARGGVHGLSDLLAAALVRGGTFRARDASPAFYPPFLFPFDRRLPDNVRRYGTLLFYSVRGTTCGP